MQKIIDYLSTDFFPALLNLYISTLRINISNPSAGVKDCVYIFWHSKMLIGWWLFKNKKPVALVSKSKDGEILSNVLNKWNYKVVRGSSSKGGKDALNEITQLAKSGNTIVITPDGPRGPANEIKNGALIISNKSGLPIIPVKITYAKKIILQKSWDKFEIPFPFSVCTVYFGKEFKYDKFLESDDLLNLKKNISEEMKD